MTAKGKKLWRDILFSLGLTIACVINLTVVSLAEIPELSLTALFLTAIGAAVFFVWYSKNIFIFPSTFAITAFVILAILTVCFFVFSDQMMSSSSGSTGWEAFGAIFSGLFYAALTFFMIVLTVTFPPLIFGILLLASFITKKCLKASAENKPSVQADSICETENPQTEAQYPETE